MICVTQLIKEVSLSFGGKSICIYVRERYLLSFKPNRENSVVVFSFH